MNKTTLLFASAATVLLAGSLQAQGADLCTSPQLISATGQFAFDNTGATTDGSPDPHCPNAGQDTIENDVWYSWVAPMSGLYTVSTCGQAEIDTKIGIYDGTCMGAVLLCDDDGCPTSTESEASWRPSQGKRTGLLSRVCSGL